MAAASARQSTRPVLRSLSPARKFYSSSALASTSTSSIRFSLDREMSPNRSISVMNRQQQKKKTCMCSPTNHPGSFRCSMHKKMDVQRSSSSCRDSSSIRLHMRRSAMANSIVRIGTVEGELVKRALAALIRPSSHQQRRRVDFERRPSRLSFVS